jgi:TM2 domain-containing membrane protein YozV
MSDGPQSPGQPEPGRPRPDPPTRPQTWPELPTVPVQQAPPAWPQQLPQPWPQQAPAAPPAWPQQQASPQSWPQEQLPSPAWPQQQVPLQSWPQEQLPPPVQQAPPRPAGPARERYAVRPPPEQYGQQYTPGQQFQEWAPLPLHAQEMQPVAVAPKNPAVSVLLSVFVPGLGSMVNGNAGTGVAILVLNIIGWMLAIVLIGIPLAIGTWIWGLVDAHQSAQRWNRAHGIIS